MDSSQSNGASAPPAEEQVRRTEQAAAGGNLVEGDPSVSSRTPQASVQAAQSIAQGDNQLSEDASGVSTGRAEHRAGRQSAIREE